MYETGSQRSYVAGRAIALGLTLGAAVLLLVLIAVLSARRWVPFIAPDSTIEVFIIDLLRWSVLLVALTAALAVIFHLAQQGRTRGVSLWIGIGFATAASVISTAGFSYFVGSFGNYQATYGALAGVIVLLVWLWVAMWSILAGACVHAEHEALAQATN